MSQGGQRGEPARETNWFEDWSARTPYVTRHVIISLCFLYILSFFSDVSSALVNCASETIFSLHLWRPITAPFIQGQLLSVLFSVLAFSQMGPRLEAALGSTKMLVLVAKLGTVVQLNFLFVITLLAYNPLDRAPQMMLMCSYGFWTILFALITLECQQNPDQPRFLFMLPCPIQARWYPWALLALFSLLSGLKIDYVLSIVTGYLQAWGYLNSFEPSEATIERWEEEGWLSSVAPMPGYIKNRMAAGGFDLTTLSAGSGSGSGGAPPSEPSSGGGGTVLRAPRTGQSGADSGGDTAFPGSGRALGSG